MNLKHWQMRQMQKKQTVCILCSDKLKRAFEYFERMASSDSADVTEVLEFTVIENLMSNGQTVYDEAKQYMGTNMIECCKRAEQFLQVGE